MFALTNVIPTEFYLSNTGRLQPLKSTKMDQAEIEVGEEKQTNWQRAMRLRAPFIALAVWLAMAVVLVVWAATQ